MTKFIVGLTGGIGSGKTTIANIFAEFGIDIVDADIVAREVVEPGTKALTLIADHFGTEVITRTGQLDRALLRSKIFSNDDEKQWLNNCLHPLIRTSIQTQVAAVNSPYCLLVAPLLIENHLHEMVDRVLVVDVSIDTQIQRTLSRDNSSSEEIKRIIASQATRAQRRKLADDIISNQSNQESEQLSLIRDEIKKHHLHYLALSRAKPQ